MESLPKEFIDLEGQMQDVRIIPCPQCFRARAIVLSERQPLVCEECRIDTLRLSQIVSYPSARRELDSIDLMWAIMFCLSVAGLFLWRAFA